MKRQPIIYIFFLIFPYFITYSANFLLDSTYAFNGTIKSIHTVNGVNYIGGGFTKISLISGYATKVDKNNGSFDHNFSKINGRVNVIIPDGKGGFFLGGEFTKIGNVIRNRLAHFDSLGHLTSFAPNVNMGAYPFVYDIKLHNNLLYISGSFLGVNNTSRTYVACLDLNGNLTNWNPRVNDEVFTINASDSVIYFGGNFQSVNNQDRYYGAAVDLNGNLTSWDPQSNNSIRTIDIKDNKIYIGGNFTRIKGIVRNRFAVMSEDGFLEDFAPDFNNIIEKITHFNNDIYVGGRFTKVNNTYRPFLCAFDSNNNLTNFNPELNAKVNNIVVDTTGVFICGSFSQVNYTNRSSFAHIKFDETLSDWNPNANSTGLAICPSNDFIFIGGIFNGLGGYDRNYIAAFDLNGNILDWDPKLNSDVYSIFSRDSLIFISGMFTRINNLNITKFAALKSSNASVVNLKHTFNGFVNSLVNYNDKFIIAGSFTKIDTITRNYIAAFDNDFNLLELNFNIDAQIFTMDNINDVLYIGGFFTKVNNQTRNFIAAVDTLGNLQSWNPIVNNAVLTIDCFKNNIFIGGWFDKINNQVRNRIARFNFDGSLNAFAPNPNNTVWSIISTSEPYDMIYLGGDFTKVSGQTISSLAAMDINGILIPWTPNPDKSVYTLSSTPNRLFAGGLFQSIENTMIPNYSILAVYSIAPTTPSLVSPTNNSQNISLKSKFDWTTSLYTSNYRIQFSLNNNFDTLLFDTTVSFNYFKFEQIRLLFDTIHYWRVRAQNSNSYSSWSEVWTFRTKFGPPTAPILIAPIDSTTEVPFGYNFNWDTTATNSESFQIQFSNNSDFENIIHNDSNLKVNNYPLPTAQFQPNTRYYWKVRGINESGEGMWSEVFTFVIKDYIYQKIQLKVGWNQISSYILPTNDSIKVIFKNIKNNIQIVKNSTGKSYIPQFNVDNIIKWNYLSGYYVYCKIAQDLNIYGEILVPDSINYNLLNGTNLISYIRTTPMQIETALNDLIQAGKLVMVKDQSGKVFVPQYGINQIRNMIPGQSYNIYLNSPTIFSYPPND